ncbi:unnamed protein product, partial [Amoebophrya sp. A25]
EFSYIKAVEKRCPHVLLPIPKLTRENNIESLLIVVPHATARLFGTLFM